MPKTGRWYRIQMRVSLIEIAFMFNFSSRGEVEYNHLSDRLVLLTYKIMVIGLIILRLLTWKKEKKK